MKKIGIILASLALLLLPLMTMASPVAYADANADVKAGLTAGNTTGGPSVDTIITTGLNLFSFIIGVVAVIMIMFAGFRFITANGDANQVSSARNTIIYAIVGLVVVAMAQVIVRFVLHKVA